MKKYEINAPVLAQWLRNLVVGAAVWLPGVFKVEKPVRGRFVIHTDDIDYTVTVTRCYKRRK